jgi:hypothetical protein
MKKIQIDTNMLLFVLEDHGFERDHYLDIKTGEIITLTEFDDLSEGEELKDIIDADQERYLYIEPLDSQKSFNVMERFLDELPVETARNKLNAALMGYKPFRRFKDTLYDYPEIKEKWFLFHNQELKQIAQEWLHYNDIDAELSPLPEESEKQSS